MKTLILLCVFAGALLLGSSPAADPAVQTMKLGTTGLSITLPAELQVTADPTSSDGFVCRFPDGPAYTLRVSAPALELDGKPKATAGFELTKEAAAAQHMKLTTEGNKCYLTTEGASEDDAGRPTYDYTGFAGIGQYQVSFVVAVPKAAKNDPAVKRLRGLVIPAMKSLKKDQ